MRATALATVVCSAPRAASATNRASARAARIGVAVVPRSPVALLSVRGVSAREPARPPRATSASAPVGESDAAKQLSLAETYLAGVPDSASLTLPLADVELCAELDGFVVRAHRGVLAVHSRAFGAAFEKDDAPKRIVVVGKTGADLLLMLSWMYRCEHFTTVRSNSARLASHALLLQ